MEIFDGATIPAASGSFDWVTIVDVLHHTDNPGHLVAEAARVARKGVVIKDHLRDGPFAHRTLRFMDWVGNKGHDVRLPYNYLSRQEWEAMFGQVGLKAQTGAKTWRYIPFQRTSVRQGSALRRIASVAGGPLPNAFTRLFDRRETPRPMKAHSSPRLRRPW